MSLTINTNLSSLIVQSSLTQSTDGLNQAIERMTTGFKINGAKDNAANYSISTSLASKLSSYNVAQDNVSMGLDMITTAEDSLSLISSHLSRIRDLAEQASNGTYGEESLRAISSEVNARLEECERIISHSEYNGIKLFGDVASSNGGGEFIEEITPLTEEEAIAQGYTVIKTAEELQGMKDNLSGKYILMNDIDLSGYAWEAIGDDVTPFAGEFNGNGHVISNLNINKPTESFQGLFGVGSNCNIKNVGLENVDVVCDVGAGALAGGVMVGDIVNCYVSGNVSAAQYAGGLLGVLQQGNVSKSYSLVDVSGSFDMIGGLVGWVLQSSSIKDSYAKGEITGGFHVGGLVGYLGESQIIGCYSSGEVSAKYLVGGLVSGLDKSSVSDCFTISKVVCKDASSYEEFGAFIALVLDPYSSITNSFYYSTVNPGMVAVGKESGKDIPISLAGLYDGGNPPSIKEELYKPNYSCGMQQNSTIVFQSGIDSDSSSQISLDLGFSYDLSIDVLTSESARQSISQIDEMLANINTKQTEFGAAYNRLESALESIGVSIDNLTSTQSTIRDADIAEESSNYIRYQILQQASATLLATANQTPSIALQLL